VYGTVRYGARNRFFFNFKVGHGLLNPPCSSALVPDIPSKSNIKTSMKPYIKVGTFSSLSFTFDCNVNILA
jgi:hypothetical protein